MNQFDGADTARLIGQVLNSRCPHGYSKRKNCAKCQSQIRGGGQDKQTQRGRSVYDTRHDADHA